MAHSKFRVGVVFPQTEIEPDAKVIGDYAQAVEQMGYSHLIGYDHVVGAGLSTRPDFTGYYNENHSFHEPMVLFGYLAGLTKTIELMSAVFILSQRQTVLFAKQAANVDIFCGGRLKLGVGVGWNEIEYEALGVPFEGRGARLDDQMQLLRRLWTEPTLSESSRFHKITDAGLNPLPIQRPIPLWVGGLSEQAANRAARLGDGWVPVFPSNMAEQAAEMLHDALKKAGRHRRDVAFENICFLGTRPGMHGGAGTVEGAVHDVEVWKKVGADGVAIDTMYLGHTKADQHLDFLRRLAETLKLKS